MRIATSSHLFGRAEPGKIVSAVNCHGGAGNVGGDKEMTGMLSAFRAMAGIGPGQRAGDFEAHRSASA